MELVKRATLAGTGYEGSACLPHLRALAHRGVNCRPFGAAGQLPAHHWRSVGGRAHHHPTPRTAGMPSTASWATAWIGSAWLVAALELRQRAGGILGRAGGRFHWRCEHAGQNADGTGCAGALERLYPTQVSTIKPGLHCYVLLLDERGYVMDDGLIWQGQRHMRYTLTFTSGGATFAELWVRRLGRIVGLDVRILNQTLALVGAINVTGPLAAELLARWAHQSAAVHGADGG
ncbi:MAG: hypothetical protein R2911_15870 [Caldilineaceae bacterium]